MDIIDLIKHLRIFEDPLIRVTGPLFVAMALGLVRSIRRLFYPFSFILKNNLSSGFLKLPVEEKVTALKLIDEYRESDKSYEVLIKEIRLKQYGLFYPIPVLKSLFDYLYVKNIRMNSTGFLSFLDCNQIFDCNRYTMPKLSLKKLISHSLIYALFLVFLAWYVINVFKLIIFLIHAAVNINNISTLLLMVVIVFVALRITYIIVEHFISFFWAICFLRKLKKYTLSKETEELMKKYKL